MITSISTCGVVLGGHIEDAFEPFDEIISILKDNYEIFNDLKVHLAYKHGSKFNFTVRACKIMFRLIF